MKKLKMEAFYKSLKKNYPGKLMVIAVLSLFLMGCGSQQEETGSQLPPPDPDDGGLTLADGFRALAVTDSVGYGRHIQVRDNGDIYVKLRDNKKPGTIAALRDTTGDGKADITKYFGSLPGTGLQIYNNYLYHASDSSVHRFPLADNQLVPEGEEETVVHSFPKQSSHPAKSITFDNNGNLYVNIGAPSNACQPEDRVPGVPGQDPCPLLETQGGIWQFSADQVGQSYETDGSRYATGIRNAVALEWNDHDNNLYLVQHGRDQIWALWNDRYEEEDDSKLPAEEMFRVNEGDNFGWPYCYYDHFKEQKLLNPEYGGDGEKVGRCDQYEDPIIAFPAHWAPNDLFFYSGDQFPERYHNGAFIAFHGSWNRTTVGEQEGYNLVFVPFENGEPTGEYEVVANNFAQVETIESPEDAKYRPMGVTQGPDGTLYVVDSKKGKIWRIMYQGEDDEEAVTMK